MLYWLWLVTLHGVSDREKYELVMHFHGPEGVYAANNRQLRQLEFISADAVESLACKDMAEAKRIATACVDKQIEILTFDDERYSVRLRNIADPPLVLYYKGQLPAWDEVPVIGVVGTRKASAYGMNTARQLGQQITRCGGLVVSGMAAGIDGMATLGALHADGTPVGVLGCGVDKVFPASNRGLFREVERRGCLISEFPPGTPPNKWNFPKRNRIISGLSCGVVVVEAPERSGALITARQALDQGRDVFVVPGNIGVASCAGSNALLRDGAIMVGSGWDVLSEYQAQYPDKIHDEKSISLIEKCKIETEKRKKPETAEEKDKITVDNSTVPPYSDVDKNIAALSQDEAAVLAQLEREEQLIDDVIARTGMPTGIVLGALTLLEIKGLAVTLPGRRVALKG